MWSGHPCPHIQHKLNLSYLPIIYFELQIIFYTNIFITMGKAIGIDLGTTNSVAAFKLVEVEVVTADNNTHLLSGFQ